MSETTRIRLDKQIQKAPGQNMIPISGPLGELYYTELDKVVKSSETLTRLDSVSIVNGELIIKYTGENGIQQVVATKLESSQQDIHVTNAILDQPGTGIYKLIITQSDGTKIPIDMTALSAIVVASTPDIELSGNGTPGLPLKATLNPSFLSTLPRNLSELNDVQVNPSLIQQEADKGGTVVLAWDVNVKKWVPLSFKGPQEMTETFRDLRGGTVVALSVPLIRLVSGRTKVYRNGERQDEGVDYILGKAGDTNTREIIFTEPFTHNYPETVIVDYQIATF